VNLLTPLRHFESRAEGKAVGEKFEDLRDRRETDGRRRVRKERGEEIRMAARALEELRHENTSEKISGGVPNGGVGVREKGERQRDEGIRERSEDQRGAPLQRENAGREDEPHLKEFEGDRRGIEIEEGGEGSEVMVGVGGDKVKNSVDLRGICVVKVKEFPAVHERNCRDG
jgi:hypothetical protein